jgi:hypothetical protein
MILGEIYIYKEILHQILMLMVLIQVQDILLMDKLK